ncbi:MAG: biopolymer transporter ExbD [Pirellulales bacterium]
MAGGGPSVSQLPSLFGGEDDLLLPNSGPAHQAHFDITAMIDLVFMMNIFFLVTTVGAALAELDLPAARHAVAAQLDESVVVSVTGGAGRPTLVYLGDGASGEALRSAEEQEQRIRAACEAGVATGKPTVLLKAERSVPMREIVRLSSAASVEGAQLHLAVIEQE